VVVLSQTYGVVEFWTYRCTHSENVPRLSFLFTLGWHKQDLTWSMTTAWLAEARRSKLEYISSTLVSTAPMVKKDAERYKIK